MAREMKDSGIEWIGEIPSNWGVHSAKYHIDIENGSDPKTEGSIPVYGSGTNSFKTCGEYKEGPAVLVGRKGSIDNPRYIEHRFWNVDTAFNVKAKNGFLLRYYYYLALSFDYKYYISQTTLPSMTQTNYENMSIPVPSFDKQKIIASFLDSKCAEIDKAIDATKASIEEYRKLRQAIITEAVTKGLDPNVEMKDSGIEWIGEIPADWNVAIFSKLGKQIKDSNKGLVENNLLSLSYGRIVKKNIDTTFGLLPESFETYNIIEQNDIVLRLTDLQNDHKSLRVGLSSERGIITSAYIAVRLNDTILPKYMYYQLHSFDVCKGFYGMGAGVRQGLNWEEVKRLQIIVPSEEEQKEIVNFLEKRCSEIDSLIKSKEKLIEELTAYRKSLIYEYVTGKKEVPVEPA